MSVHHGNCPRCGQRLAYDRAKGELLRCPACRSRLRFLGASGQSSDSAPLIGQRIGEFQILECMGQGAMGTVYKARRGTSSRMVALKVLAADRPQDADLRARFEREAKAAAAVRHGNVVRVRAAGEEAGRRYIAMELVEGESLRSVIEREGPLPAERVLGWMKQMASALAAVHEAGVIHRDIKPSNILITRDGAAKLTDFGLAKRPGVDADVTATSHCVGSAAFLPPEVARGAPADARSDLYALGVTFYFALTGSPPFDGTAAQVIVKHCETPPPPLAKAAPGVPTPLCRVIHQLLRKQPSARHSSAAALLEALERIHPSPVPSRRRRKPSSSTTRRAPGCRRVGAGAGRAMLVPLGVAVLCVLAALALLVRRPPPRQAQSVQAQRAALGNPVATPDTARPPSAPQTALAMAPAAVGRVDESLVALYTLDERRGAVVRDTSGVGEPLDLQFDSSQAVAWVPGGLSISGKALVRSHRPAAKIAEACRLTREVTIEAWVKPANTEQSGPARIVSLSADPQHRNFTLGQEQRDYVVRLRTTKTGDNGDRPTPVVRGAVHTRLTHIVYTRNAKGEVLIYINGKPQTTEAVPGDLSNWHEGYHLLFGNEATEDRAWRGELHLVAIYGRALGASEVERNLRCGPSGTPLPDEEYAAR